VFSVHTHYTVAEWRAFVEGNKRAIAQQAEEFGRRLGVRSRRLVISFRDSQLVAINISLFYRSISEFLRTTPAK